MADASSSSSSSCMQPGRLYLLDSGVRSFLATLATHILAGEIDTIFPPDGTCSSSNIITTTSASVITIIGSIPTAEAGGLQLTTSAAADPSIPRKHHIVHSAATKLSWLLRYFNPVNLSWRYYSMLAFRITAPSWGPKQLAIINFEAHPFHPPTPYVISDLAPPLVIKRLEISGFLSGQGLLSFLAAYQGLSAIYFILSPNTIPCLPTLSKPLAILGLFRVIVSKWVASKVYIEPFPYPSFQVELLSYPSNKLIVVGWAFICLCIVMLSMWPILSLSESITSSDCYVEFMICTLYQYTGMSIFLFHITSLLHGPLGLANRILYFDHWTYKVQTWGFVFLLFATFMAGFLDFVKFEPTNYLIQCLFSS